MDIKNIIPNKNPDDPKPEDRKDLKFKNATPPNVNYLGSNGRGKSYEKTKQEETISPRH